MTTLRYFAVAVLLSLLWWPVLQIAPNMRRILWDGVLETSVTEEILLFCITGLIVAGTFRRLIVRARGGWNLFYGAVLPLVAAEVFAFMLEIVQGGKEHWVGLFWAPLMTLSAFYVVIPFGLGVQLMMRWAGGGPSEPTSTDRRRRIIADVGAGASPLDTDRASFRQTVEGAG